MPMLGKRHARHVDGGKDMSEKSMTRREALKAVSFCGLTIVAAGGALHVIPAFGQGEATQVDAVADQYGFLVDTDNCVNCGNCATACRNYNGTPDGEEGRRKVVEYETGADERIYVSTSCMHCEQPSCMTVCPAHAISKGRGGVVVVDTEQCIGCKYCYQACPYGVPHYNAKGMDKCDCCLGSGVALGDSPHCVDACRFDALHYGPIGELVEQYNGRAKRVAGPTLPSCYLA